MDNIWGLTDTIFEYPSSLKSEKLVPSPADREARSRENCIKIADYIDCVSSLLYLGYTISQKGSFIAALV